MKKKSSIIRTPIKGNVVSNPEVLVNKTARASLSLDVSDYNYTRNLAKIVYVTAPDNVSISDVWDMGPPYNTVHINTLSRWSYEDGWVEAREEYRSNLEKKILDKLSKSHAKAITEQLSSLDTVADQLYELINNRTIIPKSLEGMVNALIKLEQFRFNARVGIQNVLGDNVSEAIMCMDDTEIDKDTLMSLAVALVKKKQENVDGK